MSPRPRYVALTGGVGGAKLVLGLSRVVDPEALLVVANTGDDFEHLGLSISPDLDTLMYVLAGLDDPRQGWGRAGDGAAFMAALGSLGGETWFHLGDGDLAVHVERTHRLRNGESLSAITAAFCARLGIEVRIVPMSDQPVRTVIETRDGPLAFQHYFVRERCRPQVTGIRFEGVETASAHPALRAALNAPDLAAVIICPSNPFISIDPILALPGVRSAIEACAAPVIAVSPIVGGKALKGPTAKMLHELGMDASAEAVARHYGAVLDGFVVDQADAELAQGLRASGLAVQVTGTVMQSLRDRVALAREVLTFAQSLR